MKANCQFTYLCIVYASPKLATRLYGFCLTCQHMSHCNAQDGLGVITICDLDLHQSLCALLQQPWINVLKHTRSRTSVRITKHLQFKLVCWHSHSGLCKSRSLSIYIPTVSKIDTTAVWTCRKGSFKHTESAKMWMHWQTCIEKLYSNMYDSIDTTCTKGDTMDAKAAPEVSTWPS